MWGKKELRDSSNRPTISFFKKNAKKNSNILKTRLALLRLREEH
jgi:hypothetical protein